MLSQVKFDPFGFDRVASRDGNCGLDLGDEAFGELLAGAGELRVSFSGSADVSPEFFWEDSYLCRSLADSVDYLRTMFF